MLISSIINGIGSLFDNNGDLIGLAFIYILVIGIPVLLIVLFLRWIIIRREQYVMTKSLMIIKLDDLNLGFTFNKINSEYSYHDSHPNKRKFDRDNPLKFAERHVYSNIDYYLGILDDISLNKIMFQDYLTKYIELNILKGSTNLNESKIKEKNFIKIENRLYKRLKLLPPVTNFSILYKITYTSPKGKNHYADSRRLESSEIEKIANRVKKDIKYKKTRQYTIQLERSKLTSSLRYDIMKRDNFKCQICGSTQADGVKLHVDHIYPVSKGGKTEYSNLRTLCDRCNLGKSNKIE